MNKIIDYLTFVPRLSFIYQVATISIGLLFGLSASIFFYLAYDVEIEPLALWSIKSIGTAYGICSLTNMYRVWRESKSI